MAGRLSLLGAGKQTIAVAGDWWLAGGINVANCVAAYLAKGSADYATSKVNLANPGTYNATDGDQYPTWEAATGWTFSLGKYLNTGIAPTNGWSLVVRLDADDLSGVPMMVQGGTGKEFGFSTCFYNNTYLWYGASGELSSTKTITDCVAAIAGGSFYINSSPVIANVSWSAGDNTVPIRIGGIFNGVSFNEPFSGKIYAVAFYNTSISSAQVAALTTAMNAL